jgi:hypothetical protein
MGKGTQSFPFWAIVNTDGRVEIAVSAKLFDPDDLEKLRHRFGLEREVVPEPLRGSEAPEIYPGLVPRWMAHGVGLGAAAFVLAVIVVTAISSG